MADDRDEVWEIPDETTAMVKRRDAEERLEKAKRDSAHTDAVVSRLRVLAQPIMESYLENHYVDNLLPIMRGTRHAS